MATHIIGKDDQKRYFILYCDTTLNTDSQRMSIEDAIMGRQLYCNICNESVEVKVMPTVGIKK